MAKLTNQIDQVEAWRLFTYDEEEGKLFWRVNPNHGGKDLLGQEAGTFKGDYFQVAINGQKFYAHIVVWNFFNGEIPENLTVDHIDRNTRNNRIENLRLLTLRQQQIHQLCRGFRKDKRRTVNPWKASHHVHGKNLALGNYPIALFARLSHERFIYCLEPNLAQRRFTQMFAAFLEAGEPPLPSDVLCSTGRYQFVGKPHKRLEANKELAKALST